MFDFAALDLQGVETIVDVGAGTGAFLAPALKYYLPLKEVLAIEMLPDRAYKLWCEFGPRVIHAAAGEFRDWKQIGRTVFPDSSSLLVIDPRSEEWFPPHKMAQTFAWEVEVRTLDDMCSHLSKIDLMKMDIQGYEGRAIRGGQQTLRRTRALIIEVLHCHHYEGQSTAEEIHDLLLDLGFHFDRWLNDLWTKDHATHLQGDALYVNTSF